MTTGSAFPPGTRRWAIARISMLWMEAAAAALEEKVVVVVASVAVYSLGKQ